VAVATVQEVATSLGRPITEQAEIDQVQMWLDDAELQIRLRLGDPLLLDPKTVAFVEREAVVLKVRNPGGKKDERVDDYSYGLSEAQARGQVLILDEWWAMLTPGVSTAAFTIAPTNAGPGYRTDSTGLDWS
jgi:hypothetical protein